MELHAAPARSAAAAHPPLMVALKALDALAARFPGDWEVALKRIEVLDEMGGYALATPGWQAGLEWLEKASVASMDSALLDAAVPGRLAEILAPNLRLIDAYSKHGKARKAWEKWVFCIRVLSREQALRRLPPPAAELLVRLEGDPRFTPKGPR